MSPTRTHRRQPRSLLGALSWLLLATLLLSGLACSRVEEEAATGQEVKPPVEARASADPAVATTGDVITYSVIVEHDPEIAITLPEPGAQIAGFRIIDLGQDEPKRIGERVVERRWYELRADLVGSYVLPPVTVSYRTSGGEDGGGGEGDEETAETAEAEAAETATISTSEIFVEVQSVLPADGEAADIRDIKPLQPLPRELPWRWITAGIALALLLLAAAGYWFWRRRRPAVAKPALPAHLLAFRQLDALRGTDFSNPAAVRRFHFEISEVLRGYVEGRFGLNATDLTRQEIIPLLANLPGLDPQPREDLEQFLLATDRVKFAAFDPPPEEIERTYELALGFVEATAPKAEATEAGGPSTEAGRGPQEATRPAAMGESSGEEAA